MPPSDTPPETRNRIIREALAAWRDQGLITAEQHGLLLAHSESFPEAPPATPAATEERGLAQERELGRGVTILINLGAVILAAGLIVFFASNWIEFGRAAKIASLFALTLFFSLGGFELTQEGRWNFPKLGTALVFLGCVMFGVDIVLLALIYDLTARHAWSLLMDWAVWLSVAYLLRSRLILFLGLVGITSWFGAEVGYLWGGYWIYLGRPFHFIGLGACLLAVSGIHAWRGQRSFSAPYALVGLLLIYLSTLILSIFDVQRGLRSVEWQAPFSVWLMLYGPYFVALVALALIHVRWRQTALTDPPVLVVLFFFALTLLFTGIAWTPGHREVWFILLLTLFASAGIYLGVAWESPVFLNTSIVFFALNLYTRFYEYFWDAMPKSLFFIIGGATLIFGGIWVERLRRKIVRRFAGETA
jgi:uncharacterized membrane protein